MNNPQAVHHMPGIYLKLFTAEMNPITPGKSNLAPDFRRQAARIWPKCWKFQAIRDQSNATSASANPNLE
jgi:hypothetical protein